MTIASPQRALNWFGILLIMGACSTNDPTDPIDASTDASERDGSTPPLDADINDADATGTDASDAGTPGGPCLPPSETSCSVGTGGETLLFVVDSTLIAQVRDERGAGVIPGFDHDGVVSTSFDEEGCFFADVSSGAPENIAGVDSQLGPVLDDLSADDNIDDGFTNALQAGLNLLLIEVEGVDDPTDDDCVHVNLLYGKLPTGTARPLLDPGGRYVADQVFDIYKSSLDGADPRFRLTDGRIVDGRLHAGQADVDLPTSIRSSPNLFITTLPFQSVQLRATLGDDGLSNGILAGALNVGATADALDEFLGSNRVFFETIAGQRADIRQEDGDCVCTSSGYEITASPATRGIVVDVEPPEGSLPLSSL